ncbi:RecQ family ATP-dependent DNA helicase [Colletotrichum orchidophilum]|uniref:RecQ family ATP-dependent DNA helicase n=1 Tax=Colletotrichum orchidophilum TaxID=1209926 RepID=A0A1G4AVC1_9PEZI|nr:RecQ family ATP-dependent DNA helicase [Colletotrichum orchidophilum]OHE93094.1 RecQ family ATP-dependent DNA helicase [Colletotrichum orchidophilum]
MELTTHHRPQQCEIIATALAGKDVFVQAATSFGKSLCFQLPTYINYSITIVINQVEAMRSVGINASSLNSNTPPINKYRIN